LSLYKHATIYNKEKLGLTIPWLTSAQSSQLLCSHWLRHTRNIVPLNHNVVSGGSQPGRCTVENKIH